MTDKTDRTGSAHTLESGQTCSASFESNENSDVAAFSWNDVEWMAARLGQEGLSQHERSDLSNKLIDAIRLGRAVFGTANDQVDGKSMLPDWALHDEGEADEFEEFFNGNDDDGRKRHRVKIPRGSHDEGFRLTFSAN